MTRKDPEHSDRSADTEQRSGEDFLQRWSRRKLRAREDLQPPAVAVDPPAGVPAEQRPAPLTDADMPSIDSLSEDSDVGGFFSPGVSDKLRELALKKVFALPVYNLRDGLDDYDDDYTSFEPLGDTVTADMRHRLEREAAERERKALEQQRAESEATETDAGEPAQTADTGAEDSDAEAQDAQREPEDPLEPTHPEAPHRDA